MLLFFINVFYLHKQIFLCYAFCIMKKKGTKNISYTQRLIIERLSLLKKPIKEIAHVAGLSLSAVYRELKRGYYKRLDGRQWIAFTAYSADISQKRYEIACSARGRPIKLGNDYDFVRYVEKRVCQDKLSPCAVIGEIKRNNLDFKTKITKTTLYRWIGFGYFQNIRLKKRKTKYRKIVIKRAPRGTSIELRPKEIGNRNTFGHWEMDCVCGTNKTSLLTFPERLTRKEIIFKIPNKKTITIISCLNKLEHRFGKKFKLIFKSITVDNGVEFSDFQGMEKSIYGKQKRTSFYYCHPYCSSERGTNERLNREIRRLIPKGSNLSKYSDKEIQQVEDWVNSYPRQVLGFATSAECFQNELAKIAV